jgi:3-phosphoshikimate 1-carboxyvinyltransferase
MIDADRLEITPALAITGVLSVPGDKAISHRLAILGAIAEGTTVIRNFAASADCASTLECLQRLGVPIHRDGSTVRLRGCGLQGLQRPGRELDAGNSGSTVRFMSGLVAGFPFESTFIGDASLSRRPMKRVIDPLRRFGATIEAREDNYLPMTITGGVLRPIEFTLPIASAQVKSSVLFAGLHAMGTTTVHEPVPSRNHTELALAEFGARIRTHANTIEIEGNHPLRAKEFSVPGDVSSAAFFVAAALAVPNSKLLLTGVGLNPTRSGFIKMLEQMQAKVTVTQSSVAGSEPIGNIMAETSEIAGTEVGGNWIPNVIDEIPMLAVLGTRTQAGMRIRDAAELRAKESDRIHAVAVNLRALGAEVEEFPDGLFVPGRQTLRGGVVDSFGDHRIAMAFAVAGLFATGPVIIKDPACVAISFPGFFQALRRVTRNSGTVA